mgnify:CR=1 FL=1
MYVIQQEFAALKDRNEQQRKRVDEVLTERLNLESKAKQVRACGRAAAVWAACGSVGLCAHRYLECLCSGLDGYRPRTHSLPVARVSGCVLAVPVSLTTACRPWLPSAGRVQDV